MSSSRSAPSAAASAPRLALDILALDGANVLLLDEPTNHLDIPTREALQELLEGFKGTILLVSHDRYLIDRLATQIWEIRDHALHVFRVSYREYVLRSAAAPVAGAKPQTILPAPWRATTAKRLAAARKRSRKSKSASAPKKAPCKSSRASWKKQAPANPTPTCTI